MSRLGSLSLVFLLAGLCFAAESGKSTDWHLNPKAAPAVYARSAFLHGYMHGYEDGFHLGDLDLHMVRGYQDVLTTSKYRKRDVYRVGFGNRHLFEAGYKEGLRVGYGDAYAERPFRAVSQIESAAETSLAKTESVPDVYFDDAVAAGYKIGQTQGLSDGRGATAARSLPADCSAMPQNPKVQAGSCDAFQFGYRIGYGDGYTNQLANPTLARK